MGGGTGTMLRTDALARTRACTLLVLAVAHAYPPPSPIGGAGGGMGGRGPDATPDIVSLLLPGRATTGLVAECCQHCLRLGWYVHALQPLIDWLDRQASKDSSSGVSLVSVECLSSVILVWVL